MPFLSGIEEIADIYDGFIFDVWGVLYNGVSLFDGVIPTLTHLHEQNKQVVLLTNSPRRSYNVVDQLETRGLPRHLYKAAISSGELAYQALQKQDDSFHSACGKACFFIGPERFKQPILDQDNIRLVDTINAASFVCISNPRDHYSDTAVMEETLSVMLDRQLPLLCTNPDMIVRIGDETYPCGGMYAYRYKEMGGNVFIHGKPYEPCYKATHEALGIDDKTKIIAIGDSIKTDIQGAKDYGIDAIFNLPGIHWDDFLDTDNDNRLCEDRVSAFIQQATVNPDYIMNGLTL